MNFSDTLRQIQFAKATNQGLLMQPELAKMPLPMLREDDPFLPWGKAIIASTRAVVCCYVFDLAAYMAIGAAGMVALERTIAFARAGGDVLTVLHGPFASSDYAVAAGGGAFNVDGVTISHTDLIPAYRAHCGDGVFAMLPDGAVASSPVSAYSGAVLCVVPQKGVPIQVMIMGSAALYSSMGDDFAQAVRAALIAGAEGGVQR